MQVHTFRAESLQAALQQVRHTLGPDASILHTREKRRSRLAFFAKTVIEVEAAVDVPVPSHFGNHPRPTRGGNPENVSLATTSTGQAESPSAAQAPAAPHQPNAAQVASSASSPTAAGTAAAGTSRTGTSRTGTAGTVAGGTTVGSGNLSEAGDASLEGRQTGSASPETLSAAMLEVQADLLSSGMSPSTAAGLLREVVGQVTGQVTGQVAGQTLGQGSGYGAAEDLEDPWALRGRIGQRIAARLKVSGSIELSGNKPHVVALVGPTGVGKTTTLAKIAAGFRFDLGCRIGLIALDTFRLGAVDQLLQYAELISASLEVVSSAEQVTAALQRLSDCDLVLLDTAGRAPRDTEQIVELRKFLELAQPHSTQLVVSATSSAAHVEQTVERFAVLSPTNLLITKLDEAVDFGSWLALLDRCPLPISYLTHGQQVPQDIMVASSRRLASLLLGHLHPHAGNG